MSATDSSESPDDLSLVRDDLPFRLQRRVGLIPRDGGLGVGRRALFWTALAWLPPVIWAWHAGRLFQGEGQTIEPLIQHLPLHARLLFGIPLLIVAEAIAQRVGARLIPQFVSAGLVKPDDSARFHAILTDAARLRDAVLPWVIVVALALVLTLTSPLAHQGHELEWAREIATAPSLGFGGWWCLYVGRLIFVALSLGWLWRLLLLAIVLKRVAKLDLAIVPTHPDHAGGLAFLERFTAAFSLVAFVPAMVISASWAHDAVFHDLDVRTLYPMMGVGLALTLIVYLSPYFAFMGPLGRAKRQALLDYGALVGRHGRGVRNKWIVGDAKIDDPLLSAPEIGPVADTVSLYETVQKMRPTPLGKAALLAIAVPVVIPFVAVLAIKIPLKDLLQQLAKGLL